LLTGLTKRVLESALDVELTEHLGHAAGQPAGPGGNVRNGYTPKTVRTEIGDVRVQVPRDRAGSFDPVIVGKHARRLEGFDESVISLYATGMTTGDIANHLADVYGPDVSRDLVSAVTDRVVEDMQTWQNRPLDRVYPVLLIDALVLKVRDGQVSNRPVYVAMGIPPSRCAGGRCPHRRRPPRRPGHVGRPGRRGGRQAVDDHAHRTEEPGRR
jgi:transposase-like protein